MFSPDKILYKKISQILTKHLYLLLLIPPIFIVYPMLGPGIILFGDFPSIETSLANNKSLSTWIDYGSYNGFETLSRYPILFLGNVLSTIHIGPDTISKSLVVLGFLTASFSFYFSSLFFFKDKLGNYITLFRIAAIIGSLYYAYNVWSFHRIGHWYLWLGYSMLPLFLVSVLYALKKPNRWKYVLTSVLIWSVASSTPHMVIFYGLFYLTFSLFFILRNIGNNRALIRVAKPILSIISFYLLINLYWIYPYILYGSHPGATTLLPSTHVTEEMTAILSRDSNFLNVMRLIEDWWQPRVIDVNPSSMSLLYPLWVFVSFVFPLLAFSSLFLKKNKYVLLLCSMAIIGILLTVGTNAPFNLYSILLFEAPVLSTFQYVFRDPDKWAFMIAFSYSALLSITTLQILKRIKELKYKTLLAGCFLTLISVSFLLYSYPTYSSTAQKVLDPLILPVDFEKLNAYLRSDKIEKVFYMFQDYGPTTWNKQREFCCLEQRLSAKPNMMTYLPNSLNYHEYLKDLILSNKSNNMNNFIYPLGIAYVIYSNDELNPDNNNLRQLSLLKEFRNIAKIGFFTIFRAEEKNNVGEINIPKQNIVLVGGLDLFNSLNFLPSFSSKGSSISFLDQNMNDEQKHHIANSTDFLALGKNMNDLTLSILDSKYVTTLLDKTNHDDPSKVWSKSAAGDIENADFQQQLRELGIQNWDFDYGKGLVITYAMGAKLSIPLEIKSQDENSNSKDSTFHFFMRYLKNQKGGTLRIFLDNKLVKQVDTSDRISNKFEWQELDSLNLTKGKHTITLENIAGFNVVNVFALIPTKEMNRLGTETAHMLAAKTKIIYILEAESNFHNNKGRGSGSFHDLSDINSANHIDGNSDKIFTNEKNFSGQFKVPSKMDLVALQFLTKKELDKESSFPIKHIEISPAYKKYDVLKSDFEKVPVPLSPLNQVNWINERKDILSSSLDTIRPIDGNSSLRVDIEQGNFTYWGTMSSDFIPLNEAAYYNYSLDVSAKDVIQLHSKVFYYDSNKKQIKSDFIFSGRDGSFEQHYKRFIIPPIGTRYIKLQMWVSPNPKMHSSYLLDNARLEEIIPSDITFNANFSLFRNLKTEMNQIMIPYKNNHSSTDNNNYEDEGKTLLNTELVNENSTYPYRITTESFPVKEDHIYNYTIILEQKNVQPIRVLASFKSSGDVVENSTRYGSNASNGRVLSLSPSSGINTRLNIIKPSNYTIALRAKTCDTCTFLRMDLEGTDDAKNINTITKTVNISSNDKVPRLKWLYVNNTYLKQGTYEFKIYSDSQTDIDSVIIYQISNPNDNSLTNFNKKQNETLDDLFSLREISIPANLTEYKKIDSTKFLINIHNATRPYILSFAEAYDPLWTAHTYGGNKTKNVGNNNFETGSIPLYSVVNGFYINQTGDYSLIIEYQPQKWFIEGGIVSLAALVTICVVYFIELKWICLRNLSRRIWSFRKAKK
jgi:hypothetical protein